MHDPIGSLPLLRARRPLRLAGVKSLRTRVGSVLGPPFGSVQKGRLRAICAAVKQSKSAPLHPHCGLNEVKRRHLRARR